MADTSTSSTQGIEDITGKVDVDLASLWERLDNMLDGFIRLIPSLIIGVLVFIGFYFLSKLVYNLVEKMVPGKSRDHLGMVLGRLASWATIFVGILVSAAIIAPSVTPGKLLSTLGIGGVAIGFAFKDILQNFLAGVLLLLRQPFEVGDQIVYGDYEGTVETIETRSTLLKTYDGRRVVIPNGEIYTQAVVVNTAFEKIRSQYDVGIGYGDDIEQARAEILKAVNAIEGVLSDPAPEVLVAELAGSSVNLRARWWTRSTRSEVVHTDSRVKAAIKQILDDAAIDMPYPTQVLLFHDQTESTDGDRGAQREGWPAIEKNPESRKIADVMLRRE